MGLPFESHVSNPTVIPFFANKPVAKAQACVNYSIVLTCAHDIFIVGDNSHNQLLLAANQTKKSTTMPVKLLHSVFANGLPNVIASGKHLVQQTAANNLFEFTTVEGVDFKLFAATRDMVFTWGKCSKNNNNDGDVEPTLKQIGVISTIRRVEKLIKDTHSDYLQVKQIVSNESTFLILLKTQGTSPYAAIGFNLLLGNNFKILQCYHKNGHLNCGLVLNTCVTIPVFCNSGNNYTSPEYEVDFSASYTSNKFFT